MIFNKFIFAMNINKLQYHYKLNFNYKNFVRFFNIFDEILYCKTLVIMVKFCSSTSNSRIIISKWRKNNNFVSIVWKFNGFRP
jgi:hypothetical protein